MRCRHGMHTEVGLTLTELLFAITTSLLLLGSMVSYVHSQRKSYVLQEHVSEMTLNARAALDIITKDARMAGYGTPTSGLENWIDWLRDDRGTPIRFTSPVRITRGDAQPDTLMLIGCFDPPMAHLSHEASPGDDLLHLRYARSVSKFDMARRKVVYIGRNEHGVVAAASNRRGQNSIRIDTDLSRGDNQGIEWRYPGGSRTPVELLKVITYKIDLDSQNYDAPTPVLKRDENTGSGSQPLAEYIEDFRLTRNGDTLTITLTARTPKPDPLYSHPTAGDGYRRLTVTSQVKLRNLSL